VVELLSEDVVWVSVIGTTRVDVRVFTEVTVFTVVSVAVVVAVFILVRLYV